LDLNATNAYGINELTDGFPVWELTDGATNSSFRICPARGGIVTHCRLHGRELLYLDRDTFLNPEANIRGGIPVLFPICGQLVGGQYEWKGHTYRMKNHGVARILPWEIAATGTDNGAYITLVLHSNEETLQAYPFEFSLTFTYRLKNGELSIEQQYLNRSGEEMPMVTGFHPYFATDGKNLAYDSDATKYLDYNDNKQKPFAGSLDLNGMVESAALLDAGKPEIAFPLTADSQVRLSYSEAFRYVVLWSVEDKPFVCVEPWTALNEALNTQEGLTLVAPGEALELSLQVALENR